MDKFSASLLGAAATAGVALSATPALAGGEAGSLTLRDAGGRFVGFTTETADDGSINVKNPMYVQFMLPATKRHSLSVVMIHGGGGQGSQLLETPDGRDGWADYFVADGWDVYVVDRPGHGRSQSNPGCEDGKVSQQNSAGASLLAASDPSVWPGGAPSATNSAVISFSASARTAPDCGDDVAAEAIATLLDQIGPSVLVAASRGGVSTFRVPDRSRNVAGIIAFEAVGSNPAMSWPRPNGPPMITGWKTEPAPTQTFTTVDRNGCLMLDQVPSPLVNYANLPVVLVGSEMGMEGVVPRYMGTDLSGVALLECWVAVWEQAGVDASSVYLPDRGLAGSGHLAFAQLDNAKSARVFIDLAADIERKATR